MPNKPATPSKNVRVPKDLWESAKAVAKSEGRSLSEIIRQMLAAYVEKRLEREERSGCSLPASAALLRQLSKPGEVIGDRYRMRGGGHSPDHCRPPGRFSGVRGYPDFRPLSSIEYGTEEFRFALSRSAGPLADIDDLLSGRAF